MKAMPVAQIADFPAEIGLEAVFRNENGEFSLRLFSGREVAASPDTKTPHQVYEYEVVDGPKKVHPMKNGPGEEYVWKVRKLRIVSSTRNSGLIVSNGSDGKGVTTVPTSVQ